MLPTLLTDTVTPDLDRALHYAALWGLEAVELRTVGGPGERVPFVNRRKLLRRLEETEFAVAAVVPGLFEGAAADRAARLNELAALKETLDFCRHVGCRRIVASAFAAEGFAPEAAAEWLRRAGDAAGAAGLTLALLNEADGACPTGEKLAALLGMAAHPAVGAAWSPAEALAAGENPDAGLAALAPHVRLVRFRDGLGTGAAFQETEPGEGSVDWPAQLAALAAAGFSGPVSLEVRAAPKAKVGVRAGARLVHLIRRAGA